MKVECAFPDRNEYIVFCKLTESQIELYTLYVKQCLHIFKHTTVEQGNGHLLEVISSLRKIVNHPYLFYKYHQKKGVLNSGSTHAFNAVRNLDLTDLKAYKQYRKEQDYSSDEFESVRLAYANYQMSGKFVVLQKLID